MAFNLYQHNQPIIFHKHFQPVFCLTYREHQGFQHSSISMNLSIIPGGTSPKGATAATPTDQALAQASAAAAAPSVPLRRGGQHPPGPEASPAPLRLRLLASSLSQ